MKAFSKKAYSAARKAGVEKEKAKDIAKGMYSANDADDGADDEDLEKAEKELGGHMEPDGDEEIKKGDSALKDAISAIKSGVGRVLDDENYKQALAQATREAADVDVSATLAKQSAALSALTKGVVGERLPNIEKGLAGIHVFLKGVQASLDSLEKRYAAQTAATEALVKGMTEKLEVLRAAPGADADLTKGDKLGVPVTTPKAVTSATSPVPSPNDEPAKNGAMTVGEFMSRTDAMLADLKKGDKLDAIQKVLDARLNVNSGVRAKDAWAEIAHLLPSSK